MAPEHERVPQRDAVDLIAESLMPGRTDVVRQLFAANGAAPPMILWSPGPEEIRHPLLRRFAEICRSWAGPDGRVREDAVDLTALGNLSDWLMRVERRDGTFVYTYYGAGILRHYGRDMTGEAVSAFGGHIAQFLIGVYTAAARRGEWVMTTHEPPSAVFVRSWRRLIVPLVAGDGDEVTGFAVLNLPENELRAGLQLIPDPVFVANAEQRVVFANRAALRMFELEPVAGPEATLRDMTGFALEDLPSPDEMLAHNTMVDSLQLALSGGIAERLGMTVSAAEHRGIAYYVVILRLRDT